VTHVPASLIADRARKHLGEPGPTDSCVSNGLNRWPAEVGLAPIGTASVTEAVRRARAGFNGYRYVEGTAGIARGHFGIWSHEALGSPDDEHTCVVDEVEGPAWRGIGSGTPSGKVARQPASGGMNPLSVLVGYIVAPTETHVGAAPAPTPRPSAAPTPAPAARSGTVYTIRKGDTLIRIAARYRTSWRALAAANPRATDGRSHDFHIVRPNLIIIGQKIRIP
jgi:hypothetical protein